jgi:tRNA-specific 2-thiouridylase
MSSLTQQKALIAMSGGVDSSVAALLSMERGLDCVGITMKLYENEDIGLCDGKSCCSLADAEDARRVAQSLKMPFYIFDFAKDFRTEVINRFIAAYETGRTPNPCIDCNRYIKYERLYERMGAMDFDYVVTGHYARIERETDSGRYLLKAGIDESKDQSYALYMLRQEQMAHTLFPLGTLTKTETRRLAETHGFVNARKRDSQDICFVPTGNYGDFIESYTGRQYPAGDFLDTGGRVLGRHRGIIRYTIGQRKGLGQAMGRPMYVREILPAHNAVVLGSDEELYTTEVQARDINLIAMERMDGPLRVQAKIRYNQKAMPATAEQTETDGLRVLFDRPQRAVTKGQALVLYDGDVVLGGGTIV